jgi:predicted dehydrogenase
MTVRLGFYGAGLISGFHRAALERATVPHAISAVHDPDPARAAAFAAATGAASVTEDELLDLVDAVYVTTWTSEHPRLVAKAAAAGKAVFCEKPLAVDTATAEAMLADVAAAGVINQVGLVLRFSPPMRLVKRLIADDRAGSVLAVVFRDDQFIPVQGLYGSDWRIDSARSGAGAMLEHSIHDVDLLRWWLGPVTAVSASTRTYHGHPDIDDVAAAKIDFASGAMATLVSVWHDILERPSMRHIEIICERLHITVEGDAVGPVRWRFTGEEERVLEGAELSAELKAAGDTVGNQAQAFLTSIVEGRPADPSFATVVPAHRIVDAIYRSARDGGELVRDVEPSVVAG